MRDDAQRGATASRLRIAVGAALVAVGAIVYGLVGRKGISTGVAIALVVGAGLAALAIAVVTLAVARRRADAARHRVENELRLSETRYRQFFDLVPLPIWVFDLETLAILAVNQAAVQSYGYSREAFLAMTIRDVRPEADVATLHDHLAEVGSLPRSQGIWRHRKRDGSEIEVEITAAPVTFEGRPARIVVARDVTEERRTTAALQASEARLRALTETATDAIVSADARGAITYLNPSAERMFGLEESVACGQPITVLMPESLRDDHRRGLDRFLRTGEARVIGRTVELFGLAADGREFPIELSLAAWGTGRGLAFTAVIRDIANRKRNEAALRRNAVELEAANAELDAFSYSVSHDLRAPLRSIDGFSLALLEDYGERLDDEGRAHLARVRAAAQRMAALIDDLLQLARVSRAEMHREDVDLGAMALAVVDELRRLDPDRTVEAVIGDGLVVEGDPQLLRVALANLLDNAWKYTRRNERAVFEVAKEAVDGAAVYRVSDNGVGFEMKYASKLFTPFQRLHASDEFEGTGVGLATVQRIIRRHGGRIWAEAEPGQGATFFFTL